MKQTSNMHLEFVDNTWLKSDARLSLALGTIDISMPVPIWISSGHAQWVWNVVHCLHEKIH